MWPWDGSKGFQVEGNRFAHRPDQNPFPPFPKSPFAGPWPNAPAAPRPADMIDYLGVMEPTMSLGFCFADVPFGHFIGDEKKKISSVEPLAQAALLRMAKDPAVTKDEQIAALNAISSLSIDTTLAEIVSIGRNPSLAAETRAVAVDRLIGLPVPGGADLAIEFSKRQQPPEVRHAGVRWLAHLMDFGSESSVSMRKVEFALNEARTDPEPRVAREVLIKDLRTGKVEAFQTLEQMLQRMVDGDTGPFLLSFTEAIRFSSGIRTPKTLALLQALLFDYRMSLSECAARTLTGDAGSTKIRVSLLTQVKTPVELRAALLMSLMRERCQFASLMTKLAAEKTEAISLRSKAIAAFRISVENGTNELSEDQMVDAVKQLRRLYDTTTDAKIKKVITANLNLLADEGLLPRKNKPSQTQR